MKYRVTTRGWIVFSIIGILLIFSLNSLIGGLTEELDSSKEPMTSTEENSSIENEEHSSEMDKDDNNTSNASASMTSNESDTSSEDNTVEDDEASEDAIEETTTSDNTTETSVDIDLNMYTEILFDKNIFDLDTSYQTTLKEWLYVLEKDENLDITVEGHINGYPYYEDGEFGLALALNRATIISDYFTSNGISYERINIVNMGSKNQNDMSNNEENHYLNRRAVIYFTEKP